MNENQFAKERAELAALAGKPFSQRIGTYAKLCGPGWLQSAITLGGGSLASALFLGVIGGTHFLWLQPLAMIMGVIMLSAISYVTLSTGERPFRAINQHVSPVLAWAWLIATMLANMVWVLPQFNLAWGAVQENLAPEIFTGSKHHAVSFGVLAVSVVVIWFYDSGNKGIKLFELLLKIMVGLVVLSFFGVAVALAVKGELDFGAILSGLIPNIAQIFSPTPGVEEAIARTTQADFWRALVVGRQRSVMIAAFATAVGINMTFLLPYSMLKKGWGKAHRGLAIFDLSTGLFIPFVVATGCLVIAASSQFHASYDKEIITSETPPAAYIEDLEKRLEIEAGPELFAESYLPSVERSIEDARSAPGFAELTPGEQTAAITKLRADRPQKLPQADRIVAAMILNRNQWDLGRSLEPFLGPFLAQKVFGVGVLAMAISSIIILMLINGFVLCEILNVPDSVKVHRFGCLIVGVIGFFGPSIWGSKGAWLAVPTSLIGGALLPIAYITFFMLMNSKSLLGDALPAGASRVRWNLLMGIAAGIATITTGFNLWYNRAPVPGLGGVDVRTVAFLLASLIVIGTLMIRGSKSKT